MKNLIHQNETTTVCCVCGGHISGPWPASQDVSHSYCKFHYRVAMQEIQRYHALLDRTKHVVAHAQAA